MAHKGQLDLFVDRPPEPPCQAHSATSRDAARAIEPRAENLRRQVLECIREAGDKGQTDEEIIEALSLNPSTARPRRIECVEAGLVRDSGKRRKTHSNRDAVVWIATEQAKNAG